jgi:hypothetical protein
MKEDLLNGIRDVTYGLVKVRYCKAPARLRKAVGLATGAPIFVDSFACVSTGVEQGLQSVFPARSRISRTYCRW